MNLLEWEHKFMFKPIQSLCFNDGPVRKHEGTTSWSHFQHGTSEKDGWSIPSACRLIPSVPVSKLRSQVLYPLLNNANTIVLEPEHKFMLRDHDLCLSSHKVFGRRQICGKECRSNHDHMCIEVNPILPKLWGMTMQYRTEVNPSWVLDQNIG